MRNCLQDASTTGLEMFMLILSDENVSNHKIVPKTQIMSTDRRLAYWKIILRIVIEIHSMLWDSYFSITFEL